MFFSINLTNERSAIIGCMYKSPSANIKTSTMALCNMMSLAFSSHHTRVLLVGDCNYKAIDRENEYVYQSGSRDNSSESKLLKCSAIFVEGVHACLLFNTSRNLPDLGTAKIHVLLN